MVTIGYAFMRKKTTATYLGVFDTLFKAMVVEMGDDFRPSWKTVVIDFETAETSAFKQKVDEYWPNLDYEVRYR